MSRGYCAAHNGAKKNIRKRRAFLAFFGIVTGEGDPSPFAAMVLAGDIGGKRLHPEPAGIECAVQRALSYAPDG
jgi:hypothetical protein